MRRDCQQRLEALLEHLLKEQEHAIANARNFRTLLTTYYIAIRLKHESARSLVKAIAEMNKEIMINNDLTKRDFIS